MVIEVLSSIRFNLFEMVNLHFSSLHFYLAGYFAFHFFSHLDGMGAKKLYVNSPCNSNALSAIYQVLFLTF